MFVVSYGEIMPIVTVQTANPVVVSHHKQASIAIAAMPPSRASGAEIDLYISRRVVEGIDPERDDGWGFKGTWLSAGRTAKLAEGTLILACDASYARARWYAGNFIAPTERYAGVYEVRGDELVRRVQSIRRCWAQDLIGWIRTNRPDVATFKAFSDLSARVG
jgi:hypothetical protein